MELNRIARRPRVLYFWKWRSKSFFLVGSYSALLCGQSGSATKTFVPPKVIEYIFEPVVAKDDGCARDYAQALSTAGLEQRKQIAELVRYGCIQHYYGLYHVFIQDSRSIMIAGRPEQILKVKMLAVAIGPFAGYGDGSGWIVTPRTPPQPEQVRASCRTIYGDTSGKKRGDLKLSEEQQVQACQSLGMYEPPR